jgi:eukaryotic-like serine/threonine-protein kinase
MASPSYFKYRAYLSYSHKDTSYAKALHGDLESYRIPRSLIDRETRVGRVPSSLRPIFRDRDDFAAGASLSEKTTEALAASQFLIVVCSPNSAKSTHVNEEIRRFKLLGRADRILAIIIDGEPGSAEKECFPPSLRFKITEKGEIDVTPEEPIAADLRGNADGEELARLKVVAGLLGFDLDELRRREETDRRRQHRVLASLTIGFASLALVACASAIFAFQQNRLAQRQTASAQKNLNRAIEIAYGVVKQGTSLSKRVGVPADTTLDLLRQAEKDLDDLIKDGDENELLRHRKSLMLLSFADAFTALGQTDEAAKRATEAITQLTQLLSGNPKVTQWRRDLAGSHQKLGDIKLQQGELIEAMKPHQTSLLIRQEIYATLSNDDANALDAAEFAAELVAAHGRVGEVWRLRNNLEKAREQYLQARAVAEKVSQDGATSEGVKTLRREMATIYLKIGDALLHIGQRADALRTLRLAHRERLRLAALKVDDKELQWDLSEASLKLGDAYMMQGDVREASVYHQDALERRSRIIDRDPGNLEVSWDVQESQVRMGDLALLQGKLGDAWQAFHTSHSTRKVLVEKDLSNKLWLQDFALTKMRVGQVHLARGELYSALVLTREALTIISRLAIIDDAFADWQSLHSECLVRLGNILLAQKDFQSAVRAFEDAREIRELLRDGDPLNLDWKGDVAETHLKIGDVRMSQGDAQAALKWYRSSLGIRAGISALDKANNDWQMDHSQSLFKIGEALTVTKAQAEADAAFRESLEIRTRIAALAPEHALWQGDLSLSLERAAGIALRDNRTSEAAAYLHRALAIQDSLASVAGDHAEWTKDRARITALARQATAKSATE